MQKLALAVAALAAAFLATPSAARAETGAEAAKAAYDEIPFWLRNRMAVQLYSFRDDLAKDIDGTLARVRALGFRNVETYTGAASSPEVLRDALKRAGLRPVAAHIGFDMLRDNPQAVVDYARALGVRDVGIAWLKTSPEGVPFDEQQTRAAAAAFNAACPLFRRAGLRPFYHIHGYEFHPYSGGGTLMDLLVELVPARCMELQADIFWSKHGGVEPEDFIAKYGKRVTSIHLKDMDRSLPPGDLSGHAPMEAAVVAGQGQLNIPAVLAASRRVGLRWYTIEDESPAVWEQLPQTFRYLAESQ